MSAPVPHRGATTVGVLVVPGALLATAAMLVLSWRDELPDPVASHWGPDGVDGYSGLTGLVGGLAALGAVLLGALWAFAVLRGHAAATRRFATGLGTWLGAFLGGTLVASVAGQRGLADAAAAPDDVLPGIAVALVAASALGALAAWLTPGDRALPATTPPPDGVPTLALRPGEQAVWLRRTGGRHGAAALGAVALLTAVLGTATGRWWFAAAVAALVATLVLALLRWTVVVDRAGLTARPALGPALHVPLDEVEHAEVVRVDPLRQYGGWGLRSGADGTVAVVVERGEALLVHRSGGRRVVVTVADAAGAAGLLNSLVARARR